MKYLWPSSLLFILFSGVAEAKLAKLTTRQSIERIRYISSDGKYTYYQKADGLYLANNYQAKKVIDLNLDDEVGIHQGPARESLLISVRHNFLGPQQINLEKEIYMISLDGSKKVKVAEGVNPQLHFQDKWISYYKPKEKILVIRSVEKSKDFQVDLKIQDRFFRPQVTMLNSSEVLFIDKDQGIESLRYYNLLTNQAKTILKADSPNHKLEVCQEGETLYIGRFLYNPDKNNSIIWSLSFSDLLKGGKLKAIYKGSGADIGNMLCSDKSLYLIGAKNFDHQVNIGQTELMEYNTETKKTTYHSDFRNVTQVFMMDQTIVLPYRGEFFILKDDDV